MDAQKVRELAENESEKCEIAIAKIVDKLKFSNIINIYDVICEVANDMKLTREEIVIVSVSATCHLRELGQNEKI